MESAGTSRPRFPRSLVLGLVAAVLLAVGGVLNLGDGHARGWAGLALAAFVVGMVVVAYVRGPSRVE